MLQFSRSRDHFPVGFQFCDMESNRCQDCGDFYVHWLINNIHKSNCCRYCLDQMMMSLTMMGNHPITGILLVRCMVLILRKLQQTNQPFSYIARLIKLKNTNTDPPDIQVPTMQPLMGEDENNSNETETTTNDMMTGNGDGVSMSNWAFGQHNQIQSATTDTPKLCTSGSRIDA